MSLLDRSDPKVARLRQVSFFEKASKKALEHLAGIADEASVPAGRTLIEQGLRHHEAFVVQSGKAQVLIDGKPVAEVGEDEMIGELAVLLGGAASATVRAETDMELLVIPHALFDTVLEENPAMLRSIAETLAARLRAADARLH